MDTLALSTMDHTLAGLFFLVAVILFVIAALLVLSRHAVGGPLAGGLVALGLAFFAFPFMWDRFALA